ncbi:hypothetical protein N7535_007800 [Penicillium sp. DV-2018c]|nr:hypothetical protein N7535_007800 [Penicillium sp. DV-2018c]
MMQNLRSENDRPAAIEPAAKRTKRPRAAQACDRCRLKKYKCDEQYPCLHCKRSGLACVYQGNYRERQSSRSANYIADLEKKIEELTSKLHETETRFSSKGSIQPAGTPSSFRTASTSREISQLSEPAESTESVDDEINEFNYHTNGIEFHGSTSSAAIIGHLKKARELKSRDGKSHLHTTNISLITTLHNSSFSPSCTARPEQLLSTEQQQRNYYFDQAHIFMNGYFENLHFIHPFIDKESFLSRANDLWFNCSGTPELSFVALYLSVLSLGCLMRVWDEGTIAGLGRFEWSRKLFGEAQAYLNHLRFSNDLETVQCLFMMAKVCQNELNPNLAYMYLGLAVRTCLSAGFNREVPCPGDTMQHSEWISKTWWGIFSLEIEMSFSVGRPDTLGMDEYHNRSIPPRDDSEYAIIPWMIDFAQIIRRVSIQIYHSRISLQEKLQAALQIEDEMNNWVSRLPERIRPDIGDHSQSRSVLRDPKWARRQRLVLGIRYYNVRMLLFRPFLSHFTCPPRRQPNELDRAIDKCLESAMRSLQIIRDVYCVHTFFRCWWYNTTYVMFATSTLLLPMSKLGMCEETMSLLRSADIGVEILEAMDESVVARKSVEIIKQYLKDFRASEGLHSRGEEEVPPEEVGAGSEIPEWTYGFAFPDYSFEGISRLFDDIGGLPMLDE